MLVSLLAEGEVAQLSTAVQQRVDEEAAHTARTDLQGEGLRGPIFRDVDETLAVVGAGVGDGPAFLEGSVLDEATFNDVVKGEGVQDGRDGVVQDGGDEGVGCFAAEVDVCGGGEEGGEVRDGFWQGGARVDGDVRGEG